MIIKEKIIDQITFLEDGQIQVRETTVISEDGIELARNYHRRVVSPDDDVTNEDPRIKALAQTDWTPARVAKYRAEKAKNVI